MSLFLSDVPKKLHCGCGNGIYVGPKKRPQRKSEDPSNPLPPPKPTDPRPPFPCEDTCSSGCFPAPLPKAPDFYNLKLRQLADCYECRVSTGCHNRKRVFYDRWQTYLDGLKRYPNYDYKVYCCDKYKDLGENFDYIKFTDYWPARKPPREMAQRNFLLTKCLPQVHQCLQSEFYPCVPLDKYPCPWPDTSKHKTDNLATKLYKKAELRLSDGDNSIWQEKVLQPKRIGYIESTTAFRSRIKPFRKDCGFSTPLDTEYNYSTGNQAPYKQIRDLKMM